VADFTSLVGRDATLTGRTDSWAGLVPLAERNPHFGMRLWRHLDLSDGGRGPMVNEAHNGYLEVLLQLGLVGLVITSMFLLSFGRSAVRALTHDYDWASLAFATC